MAFVLRPSHSDLGLTADCCHQEKRYAEFMELKKQIIVSMEELDHAPETSFEKDVVCEDEDSFCLSRENITALKLLICQVRRATQWREPSVL